MMTADVANEINRQIGHRAFFMMGTRTKVGDERSLMFDVKGSRKYNKIRVMLDPSDTYTVDFWKLSGPLCDVKKHETVSGVYADQLHKTIEANTGLYLSL